MSVIVIGLLFVVVGTLGYMALRNAQDFSDANEVIPGVPTNAPKEWAGAHSPEARLHRRLRDAMTALRANAALDAPDLLPARTTLEQEALAVDERLVAVAAIPQKLRGDQLDQVEAAVDLVEAAVTELVLLRGPAVPDVERAIEQVRTRVRLVSEARQELEGFGSSALRDLRQQLDPPTMPEDTATPEPGAPGPGSPGAEPGTPDPGTGDDRG